MRGRLARSAQSLEELGRRGQVIDHPQQFIHSHNTPAIGAGGSTLFLTYDVPRSEILLISSLAASLDLAAATRVLIIGRDPDTNQQVNFDLAFPQGGGHYAAQWPLAFTGIVSMLQYNMHATTSANLIASVHGFICPLGQPWWRFPGVQAF